MQIIFVNLFISHFMTSGKGFALPSLGRSTSGGGVSLVSHKSLSDSADGGVMLLSSKPIDTGYSSKKGSYHSNHLL